MVEEAMAICDAIASLSLVPLALPAMAMLIGIVTIFVRPKTR